MSDNINNSNYFEDDANKEISEMKSWKEEESLIFKWDKTTLLNGLSTREEKIGLSTCLESMARLLTSNSSKYLKNGNNISSTVFPIIRKLYISGILDINNEKLIELYNDERLYIDTMATSYINTIADKDIEYLENKIKRYQKTLELIKMSNAVYNKTINSKNFV